MKIVQIITPGEGNMDLKLQLKYIVGKQLRYESHLDFLDKCYENSVIPKGFQWKWSVQLDATAEEDKKGLESIRQCFGLKLIEFFIESYTFCLNSHLQYDMPCF